ncbi:Rv3654c family TadE-like protein [[Mycobacterium] nativiensis]|uniref:Rv3654c family TadE-like protein n=1 Tax=[Mycobacterium] nativiensis TaxID=2855503 RepID=A0ABU5Y4C6_9MYCO|nr:Rv3654c family TadE-like protein [Mycolicibacter sp. MYC340]MEB3035023.1 Rv3654c family TadE-like protein [Mycolicibacter sp. MYC340]
MTSRSETGAASVVAAAMVAALLALTGGGFLLGAVVIARHRAQAIADLAALAGAARIPAGPDAACVAAQRLAGRMTRVGDFDCAVDGLDVVVTVTVALPGRRVGPVRAMARAGPPG